MRIPSYSSVLGFALVAGLIAAGVSLIRNLPDSRQYRRWQRDNPASSTPQSEDSPIATNQRLGRGEDLELRDPKAAAVFYGRWRDSVEVLLAREPGFREWYAAGWARKKTGDDAGAAAAWTRATEALEGDFQPIAFYNRARCLALLGDADGALAELGHAVDAGWDNRSRTEADRDLQPLRADPRFHAHLGRMPGSGRGASRLAN